MMNMLNACMYVLLPLYVEYYAFLHVLLQGISVLCMYMFMGLVARIVNGMVASSSLVRGSGTLQCGIGAHVAAWASMGHEELVTETSYPQPSRIKITKLEK